jgi:hypothetical protein
VNIITIDCDQIRALGDESYARHACGLEDYRQAMRANRQEADA